MPVIGPDKAHIHQMRAAKIGIVDDIDVTRVRGCRRALADQPDQLGSGILHGADKDRQTAGTLRDQRAVRSAIDAVRTVIRLGDHRREGGAGETQIHLVAGLLQPGLDDAKGDRVETHDAPPTLIRMLPSSSERALSSGRMRMVLSICSKMAGP